MKEGHCQSDNPLIACPEIKPPAYLEPHTPISPPNASIIKPFSDNTASSPKSSAGCKEAGAAIPSLDKSLIVDAEISTGASVDRNCLAINPPMMAPTKKTRFQIWFFQLKLKKLIFFPTPVAAQMVLKLDEKPKD